MKVWKELKLIRDNGEQQNAIAPVIISASRATDIPAFHSIWLINRLKKGYACRTNPFRKTITQFISFQEARLFVFWTKNPEPLIGQLPLFDQSGLNYYFQFTLNNYEKERFEPNIPPLETRIRTFIQLSQSIGKEKVIWRFDPLILTGRLTVNELLSRISELGNRLVNHTNKLVFSFVDILNYSKVQNNLVRETPFFDQSTVRPAEFTTSQKIEFAQGIHKIHLKWLQLNPDFEISTCAEEIDLEEFQISHNLCIDDRLMAKLFPKDKKLMDFIGVNPESRLLFPANVGGKNLRDKGQRKACRCIMSKDIGAYNTCDHLCVYCYANSSPAMVKHNLLKSDQESESLSCEICPD